MIKSLYSTKLGFRSAHGEAGYSIAITDNLCVIMLKKLHQGTELCFTDSRNKYLMLFCDCKIDTMRSECVSGQ